MVILNENAPRCGWACMWMGLHVDGPVCGWAWMGTDGVWTVGLLRMGLWIGLLQIDCVQIGVRVDNMGLACMRMGVRASKWERVCRHRREVV